MKKNLIRLILAAALGLGGTEGYQFAIENYGETEIVMPDGTVYEAKDIARSENSVFPKRKIENIDGIAWHYPNWDTEDVTRIADWHVNGNHWSGIGYHGAIKRDGTYLVLNSLETLSYHAKGSNTKLIGIVFLGDVGNVGLSENQIKTAKYMLDAFCMKLNIKRSVGHRDVRATECPSDKVYAQLKENDLWFDNTKG